MIATYQNSKRLVHKMRIKEQDVTILWQNYFGQSESNAKHELMLHYVWLVKYVLKQMNIPNNTLLTNEDFTNIGMLGLNDAIERYESDRGVKFESYAIPRIRGTIQDELRKLDWLSRSARKKVSEFITANDELRSEKGREVLPEEIMKKLNISPEQYQSYLAATEAAKASMSMAESQQVMQDNEEVDILESIPDNSSLSSLENMVEEEKMELLVKFLQELPEKKRLIVSLYYYEELTFKEIGQVVNVSESRVCQIHTQVISELRVRLREYDYA